MGAFADLFADPIREDQTRIATATDGFLDLISYRLLRQQSAAPTARAGRSVPRANIATLLREKATRNGMIAALVNLTGRAPFIFEPARPADTGAYSISTSGYGVAGGYGSLMLAGAGFHDSVSAGRFWNSVCRWIWVSVVRLQHTKPRRVGFAQSSARLCHGCRHLCDNRRNPRRRRYCLGSIKRLD